MGLKSRSHAIDSGSHRDEIARRCPVRIDRLHWGFVREGARGQHHRAATPLDRDSVSIDRLSIDLTPILALDFINPLRRDISLALVDYR